jgi:putative ABC transport system permease protein
MEWLKFIFKNLIRRKTRTLLTVLGISAGVAAIIGLGALADGMSAGYDSMITGSNADLIISQPNSVDISLSSVDEGVGEKVANMPEIAEISGMLEGFLQAEGSPYFFIFGYPKDSFLLDRFQIIDGMSITDRGAQRMRGKPIMIGSSAAESLKKKVGETIRIGSSVYRVVGIYQTGDGFEDSGGVLDIQEAQSLLGKQNKVSLFYIRLKDASGRQRVIERVERLWPDLSIGTTAEYADKQILDDFLQGYVWVVAGLAIVLGGVGMMNAQLMSVFERTREIGVLRAVGWSHRRVLYMILSESITVCVMGGILGILWGYLIMLAIGNNPVIFGANSTNIRPGLILQALMVVFILGITGGIYPAWRASQLLPIEALRYEGGSSGEQVHRLPVGGMALQSLWQRTTRTILTLSVIGLTVGSIMAMEGVVRGFAGEMNQMAIGADAQIMLRQADIADTSTSAIDERSGEKIAAMPEIQHISGIMFTAVVLPENGSFFILQGYSPREYAINRFNIIEGKTIDANRQIMIGKTVAEALKKKVGETLTLSNSRFKIVGIYTSSVSWEELGGIITLRDAQTFMGRPRKVSMFAVKLNDPSLALSVVDKINSQFPDVHAALSGEFADQMPDMEAMDAILIGISVLAIGVGGLGVMNTMLMAVMERTREIGVLRALGWRRRAILTMIIKEALLLAGLGALAGIIIAFGLVGLIMLEPSFGQALKPDWEIEIFIRAILVALMLGGFGGSYPAYRATKLQPVEALRYE